MVALLYQPFLKYIVYNLSETKKKNKGGNGRELEN